MTGIISVRPQKEAIRLIRGSRISYSETRDAARRSHVLNRFSDPAAAARFIVHLAGMKTVSGQLFNLDGRIYRWA